MGRYGILYNGIYGRRKTEIKEKENLEFIYSFLYNNPLKKRLVFLSFTIYSKFS